ncbi:hypothetical protein ALC62_00901, partial [Cyphomyrmex costatus]
RPCKAAPKAVYRRIVARDEISRKSGGHCVIARGNDASWQRSQQLSFAIEGGKKERGSS